MSTSDRTTAPDCILYPLRRCGTKGSGEFERIGWDDALNEIVCRLEHTIATYGGEATWPYLGTGRAPKTG
ncbi:MAG TPA: hypothetical protein DDW73_08885 [Rhizobium sp.]|nr:hypothetical protein [Rhizobium sp.]